MRSSVARLAALLYSVAMLVAGQASAAAIYWALPAGQTGDWSVASNWGGTVPGPNDNVYVANGGTAAISLPGANCLSLYDLVATSGSR